DVRAVFLTSDGEPRSRKANATQARSMGEQGQHRFLALHELISRDVLERNDQLLRQSTWRLSRAWISAGIQLLEDYQRLKRERRLLDFADLEWHTYRLLNTSGNAHWVQYKLDARIDHLLIDEFQDTNPTQWRLILPLLEELAAGASDRARSAFIVGDAKQSIYRFRRANAALLDTAAAWMEDRLAASPYTLDASRRSAPAIIDCVNRVFCAPQLKALVPDYHAHDTYRKELWGRVELSPLIESPPEEQVDTGPALRDPLQHPRRVPEDLRYHEEGRWIARHIHHLVTNGTLIGPPAQARQVQFGDILILLRSRTHAHAYEHALRQAGIPYLGAGRGTMLDSLEVRDLEALLNTLVTPYNNLALAQVLRSPVFAVSNADLVQLAEAKPGPWMLRLERLSKTLSENSPLLRAYEFLQQWRELAGHAPVHDLLDHIYHDADILARYRSAVPEPLRPRVIANLTRFIELALEVDSGRYPSLPRFLNRLQGLRTTEPDAPDETPPESDADARVRMMTIHGAKGLEAPVVFLADTTAAAPRQRAYQAIVDWPADAERPSHFLLSGPKSTRDSVSARLMQQQETPSMREEANLLYVALTRATQLLFISGSAPKRPRDSGWYSIIHAQLAAGGAEPQDGGLVLRSGTPPSQAAAIPAVSVCDPDPDPRLAKPVQLQSLQREIAPSRMVDGAEAGGADTHVARQRGLAIHTMLESLTVGLDPDDEKLLPQLAKKLGRRPDDPDFLAWWQEARGVRDHPQFAALFHKEHYVRAYNEVPIQYYVDGDLIYGIIDRLVEYDHEALVIDYKSHAHAKSA
ncbi:MAG: 3'-5' exonuclease, partial [Gammaproteobacteria bacterium]